MGGWYTACPPKGIFVMTSKMLLRIFPTGGGPQEGGWDVTKYPTDAWPKFHEVIILRGHFGSSILSFFPTRPPWQNVKVGRCLRV